MLTAARGGPAGAGLACAHRAPLGCAPAPRGAARAAPRALHVPRFGRHCARAAVEALQAEAEKAGKLDEAEEEFEDLHSPDDSGALTTQQVQALLNVVCGETEIAEMELQVGGFAMKVRRKMGAYSAATAAVAAAVPAVELPFQSTASIDESQILPTPAAAPAAASVDEEELKDENLLYIGAPKVGILRRGRYIKGKRVGKGQVADLGASVKKGQPIAYVEQLGTFVPVNAPQAGEISFLAEEGTAVEYKEVIAEIAPFFGGHIIGDKKYA